jgi:hypothetical protein
MKKHLHPLFRRYTFIRYVRSHTDRPEHAWAINLDFDFDNFDEFANYIESTIGLPPTPRHRLSRTNQELGWIIGNFCWRTGSELVTANARGIRLPVRKNGRQKVSTRDIIEMFGITYTQVYNRIHNKNYSFRDFKREFGNA